MIKQACFSIESFATACGDERNEQQSRTDALFIEGPLLQRLFGIIDRPTLLDKTRLAAFDAITALLSNCPEETSQIQSLLTQVMAEVLRRLESSFDPMAFESSQDRFNRQASLSGLVGGTYTHTPYTHYTYTHYAHYTRYTYTHYTHYTHYKRW